jgi:hypothetical protein
MLVSFSEDPSAMQRGTYWSVVVGYTGVVLPPPVVPEAKPKAEPLCWAKAAGTAARTETIA